MGKSYCPLQTQDRNFFDCDDCRFYIIFDEDENEKDCIFIQLIIHLGNISSIFFSINEHIRKIARELKYL